MTSVRAPCLHDGEAVWVGPYQIWAGGYRLSSACIDEVDVLVALGSKLPVAPGDLCPKPLVWLPLPDFGGVPENWGTILEKKILSLLGEPEPNKLAVFCHAGHGRTGTLLASLIALLEEDCDDPIAELRRRYCPEAVESWRQAEAVFALRGRRLPKRYRQEFRLTQPAGNNSAKVRSVR